MAILCPHLSKLSGISHGFFTREGGVSTGPFVSLNCGFGSGDNQEAVAQNRFYVARQLGVPAESLCNTFQIHSGKAVVIETPWAQKEAPEADAIVTKTPGIAIGVLTADCLPILFADAKNRVIGAAHAGWKGAFGGIIESTLAAMETLGADKTQMIATIGPGIEQCSYEVGDEFRDTFLAAGSENAAYFDTSSREGHFMFDLKGYARARLEKAGIHAINVLAHDTCLEDTLFYSYRRATLRGEPQYGRQISAIVLT